MAIPIYGGTTDPVALDPYTRIIGVGWGYGTGNQILRAMELYNSDIRGEYTGYSGEFDEEGNPVHWETDLEYCQYRVGRDLYVQEYNDFVSFKGLRNFNLFSSDLPHHPIIGDIFFQYIIPMPGINSPGSSSEYDAHYYTLAPAPGWAVAGDASELVPANAIFLEGLTLAQLKELNGDPFGGVPDTSFWSDGIGDGNPATLVTQQTNSFAVLYVPGSSG